MLQQMPYMKLILYLNSHLHSNRLFQPLMQETSGSIFLHFCIIAPRFSCTTASLTLQCGMSTGTHLALKHGIHESIRESTLYQKNHCITGLGSWWVDKCSSLLFLCWTILKYGPPKLSEIGQNLVIGTYATDQLKGATFQIASLVISTQHLKKQ